MKEINGKLFKLMLLDTGVISKIIKNPNNERNALTKIIISENAIPCFSIFTIFELRKRKDLYDPFLDIFSVVPFFLLKTSDMLFIEELKHYPNSVNVEPLAFVFSFVNRDPLAHVKTFMAKLFSNPGVLENEKLWNSGWKKQGIDQILGLKSNFHPSGKNYNANDATRFIKEGVIQYVFSQQTLWAKKLVNSGEEFNPSAFPSVKMTFYNVFYRFYAEKRTPEEQDVFDLFISCAAPYVDIFVTEKFQAEIFRKVKSRDPFLNNLQIETAKFFDLK